MKTASQASNTKPATISSKGIHRGKSRRCLSLMCGAILGLLSSSSYAGITGSVTLNGNLGNYLSYNWTGTNGTSYSEYVSPYPATVTYNGEINVPAYLSCMDIYNPTPVGVTILGVWNTNTASYSPALKQASWLADQLYGLTPATANPNVVGPISEAIWSIMLPSSTHSSPPVDINEAAQNWINQSSAAVSGGYVADNIWFQPNDPNFQRFMLNPPAPAPEPSQVAASILLVAGIAGFVIIRRSRNGCVATAGSAKESALAA